MPRSGSVGATCLRSSSARAGGPAAPLEVALASDDLLDDNQLSSPLWRTSPDKKTPGGRKKSVGFAAGGATLGKNGSRRFTCNPQSSRQFMDPSQPPLSRKVSAARYVQMCFRGYLVRKAKRHRSYRINLNYERSVLEGRRERRFLCLGFFQRARSPAMQH